MTTTTRYSHFEDYYQQLVTLVKPFLDKNDQIKHDLSHDDGILLNNAIASLPPTSQLKCFLDKKISEFIIFLEKKHDNFCLEIKDVWHEINDIIARLGPEQTIGYILTNDNQHNCDHFEVILLTKFGVVKPICWRDYEFVTSSELNTPVYRTKLSPFTSKELCPQVDGWSCATLGIIYLHKLLKNNAEDYKSLSLHCSFYYKNYCGENEKFYFFLPCPSVLLYSQSSRFNQALVALLDEGAAGNVLIDNKIKIITLKKTLETSISIAKQLNDHAMISDNLATLAHLQVLTPVWLTHMAKVIEQRKAVKALVTRDQSPYLSFQSYRYNNHIQNLSFFHTQKLTNNRVSTAIDIDTLDNTAPINTNSDSNQHVGC